jgi:TonB family protein
MAPPAGMDRKAMIQRAISRSRGFLAYCYEQELVRDAASAGQVLVRFQIGAGGRVEKVGVDDAGTTLKSDAMKACVEATARAWKFPPVLAESTVTYPFVFRPEGDVPAP